MNRRSRGKCLIINICHTNGQDPREGAEVDERILHKLFTELHYDVHVFKNLTARVGCLQCILSLLSMHTVILSTFSTCCAFNAYCLCFQCILSYCLLSTHTVLSMHTVCFWCIRSVLSTHTVFAFTAYYLCFWCMLPLLSVDTAFECILSYFMCFWQSNLKMYTKKANLVTTHCSIIISWW